MIIKKLLLFINILAIGAWPEFALSQQMLCGKSTVIDWKIAGIQLGEIPTDVGPELSASAGAGRFERVLFVDKSGDIYVGDSVSGAVYVFNGRGSVKQTIVTTERDKTTDKGDRISALTVDDKKNVYVLDPSESDLRVFSEDGKLVNTVHGIGGTPDKIVVGADKRVYVFAPALSAIYAANGKRVDITSADREAANKGGYQIGIEDMGADQWISLMKRDKTISKCGPVRSSPRSSYYLDANQNFFFSISQA